MTSQSSAAAVLAKLLTSEKYSDLKLVCQDHEFNVHKAVVCSQSPVLAAACDGKFLEARTNIIKIEEFDPETVRRMIAFMYTEDYDDGTKPTDIAIESDPPTDEGGSVQPEMGTDDLTAGNEAILDQDDLAAEDNSAAVPSRRSGVIHVKVNAIADDYDIPELRALANTKFEEMFDQDWCADDFSSIYKQIYTSTSDEELQALARGMVVEHIDELLQHPVFRAAEVVDEEGIAIIQNLNDKLNYMQERNENLEAFANSLRTTLEASQSEHNSTKNAIRASLHELKTRRQCRNTSCDTQFLCHIDMEPGGGFTLRCDVCNCKHK